MIKQTGLLIGAAFGVYLGIALDNPIQGVTLGTLGVFLLGWIIALVIRENDN